MSPKLAPLLVPKTVTSCNYGLQKRVPKAGANFGNRNWNRWQRARAVTQQCVLGGGVSIAIAGRLPRRSCGGFDARSSA